MTEKMDKNTDITVYGLRTEDLYTPMGMDEVTPSFTWKMNSSKRGTMQKAYQLVMALDKGMKTIFWDSGKTEFDKNRITYEGEALNASTKYYWQVTIWDETNTSYVSDVTWFETGLMGNDASVWNHAKWIGSPKPSINTAGLAAYSLSADVTVTKGKAGIVIAARNKDNYVLFEADMSNRKIHVYEYCDNSWGGSYQDGYKKEVVTLGNPSGYLISEEAVPAGEEEKEHRIQIFVEKRKASLFINKTAIIQEEENLMPENIVFRPRKTDLMFIGFKQENSRAVYDNLKIMNTENGDIYWEKEGEDNYGSMSILGDVVDKKLVVENRFELMCPVTGLHLKKTFTIKKEVETARMYATARGFYNAYINGERAGYDFYNPGFTDYRLRIQYQTYDITHLLRKGENMVGAIVGKGYYTGYCGYSGSMVYGKSNSFLGQLVITYKDGTKEVIVSDESWKYTDMGPLVDSDYIDGETFDARLDLEGWKEAGYEDSHWISCGIQPWPDAPKPTNGVLAETPSFRITAQVGPTAQIERELTPISKIENPKGHYVYDFGQNLVGTIRLKVKGARGTSIKIRYGEMSYKNGEIYIRNLRSAANTDIYTLKGSQEGETYVPAFSSHGFRYVEITGNGYELEDSDLILDITALVITNVRETAGDFNCSNPLVNQLQSNIVWGQRGNSLLVWTDCPQRNERMGWTGDAQVFMSTAAFNMDVASFTRKWLIDVIDGQLLFNRDGAVPDTAPLGGDNRPAGCGGWGDAGVIVPFRLYEAYGEKKILEECYDMMKKWVEYQNLDTRRNYGVRTMEKVEVPNQSDLASIPYIQVQQSRGDHLTFDETTPFILSATAYAAYSANLLAKTAKILGKEEDEKTYTNQFELIRKAFREAWVEEDGSLSYWGEMSKSNTDKYGNVINQTYYSNKGEYHPSQTAYALAICFDLIPEEKMTGAREGLRQAIIDQKGHLSVGFLGIEHLAPALTKAGLKDMAFSLLLQEGNPGWLYSVINGATTIWERWDSYIAESGTFGAVSMNSFNHYAYGAIGKWMYETILGIQSAKDESYEGYKKVLLMPSIGGNLTFAKGYHQSPYGTVESEWRIENDDTTNQKKFIYSCTVPANSLATLYLPIGDRETLTEGGRKIEEVKEVLFVGENKERMIYELKSGSYEFALTI